jgi:serine/threonine protein kinase
MNLKLFKLTLTICFLSIQIVSFTPEDLGRLIEDYKRIPGLENFRYKNLNDSVFEAWATTELMERVTNYQGMLGRGSGGFAFKANYRSEDGKINENAAIKFLPDDSTFYTFRRNVIQAELTGNWNNNKYGDKKERFYSFDESIMRLEKNSIGIPNKHKGGICEFYEMQGIMLQGAGGRKKYITTLVTEIGESDMSGVLFQNKATKDQNTATLLRYIKELSLAVYNVSYQKALHGDIKPENVILVRGKGINGEDRELHPKLIDFDLRLDTFVDSLISCQKRYTPGYTAPWLEEQYKTKKKDYKYSADFKEDAYALAWTIHDLIYANIDYFNPFNQAIFEIAQYIEREITQNRNTKSTNYPTPRQFYININGIIFKYAVETNTKANYESQIIRPQIGSNNSPGHVMCQNNSLSDFSGEMQGLEGTGLQRRETTMLSEGLLKRNLVLDETKEQELKVNRKLDTDAKAVMDKDLAVKKENDSLKPSGRIYLIC